MTNSVNPNPFWQAQRQALLTQHVAAANQGDLRTLLATFTQPALTIVTRNQVAHGTLAVYRLLWKLHRAFPNLYVDVAKAHYAETAVIHEGQMVGTHLGAWWEVPPSGQVINLPYVAIFRFDRDQLIGKSLYLDSGLLLHQLSPSI